MKQTKEKREILIQKLLSFLSKKGLLEEFNIERMIEDARVD